MCFIVTFCTYTKSVLSKTKVYQHHKIWPINLLPNIKRHIWVVHNCMRHFYQEFFFCNERCVEFYEFWGKCIIVLPLQRCRFRWNFQTLFPTQLTSLVECSLSLIYEKVNQWSFSRLITLCTPLVWMWIAAVATLYTPSRYVIGMLHCSVQNSDFATTAVHKIWKKLNFKSNLKVKEHSNFTN